MNLPIFLHYPTFEMYFKIGKYKMNQLALAEEEFGIYPWNPNVLKTWEYLQEFTYNLVYLLQNDQIFNLQTLPNLEIESNTLQDVNVSSYELSDNEEGANSLSTPSSSSRVGTTRVSSSESESESDSDKETCDEATNRGWHKKDFKPKQEQYLGHTGLNRLPVRSFLAETDVR
ncbi:hypothetical protein C0J52_20927 [Blattella germanica]|nr:hypothetical protein C0J52_20927 [Blattella germanica]